MGILNVTPDSFADGGLYLDPGAAEAAAVEMEARGADIIDVGGESTRPGSETISAEAEIARIQPVIARLCAIAQDSDLDRHVEGRGRRGGDWRRRGAHQRRDGPERAACEPEI